MFSLVVSVTPSADSKGCNILATAAEQVGASVVSMTEPYVGFTFASAAAAHAARRTLQQNPELNVDDMTDDNLPWSVDFSSEKSDAPDAPMPAVASIRSQPRVYGECSHQRLPICAFKSKWQFQAFELQMADLEAYGIAVPPRVRQCSARLAVVPGSVQIVVDGVDEKMARTVCEWVLESPMVAEVCENRLRQVAAESNAPLSISWGAVQFVAHSCVAPSRMVPVEIGQWTLAAPAALGELPTDTSSKALADTARRAVCRLLSLNSDDVFVLLTTRSLPFVCDVAPSAFTDLLQRADVQDLFTMHKNVATDQWPLSVRSQLFSRRRALPETASYFVPKEATAAMLLFGIRRDARALFARAHAIVQSVARHAPKHDLPTFDNVDTQMLTRIRSSEPSLLWVCIMASSLAFGAKMARRLVTLATESTNVQVIDLCGSTGIGAEIVNELAALTHVRVVAIAGMADAERVVKQMRADLAEKMVWTPFEVMRQPSARDEAYVRHAAFYAFQEQARRAWQYWGVVEKE